MSEGWEAKNRKQKREGLVLKPMLFNLFINSLELEVSSVVSKFADDSKLFRTLKTKVNCKELQEDLHKPNMGNEEANFQYR